MITSATTVTPVKHPSDGRMTSFLNVGVTINEAQGGLRCVGSKNVIYVPWSNVAYCLLDTSNEAPIVVPPEPLVVEFPPPEAAPEAPVVKVKKGPFGRPLKPPAE